MRHWALALIAALAVLTSGVASNASAADPNLLSNPSFEDTSDAVWNPLVAGSYSASGFPIPTPIPDGNRFMLLIGYPGGGIPAISQNAGPVVPGATYNFSFSSTARSDSSPRNIGIYGPLSALQFTASLVVRNGLGDTVIGSVFVNPDLQSPSAWVKTAISGTVPANATGNIVVKFVGTGFRGNNNQQTAIDLVDFSIPVPPDTTAPTINAAATTSPNVNGWYNGNVVVNFTCAEEVGGSGIPSGACPSDQLLNSEGVAVSSSAQTVTDTAGNVSLPSNVVTVKIDKTDPTLTPVVSNPVYLNGAVTISAGAADALSGIASASCGAMDTTSLGAKSVTCSATDLAGNTAQTTVSYTVFARVPVTKQDCKNNGWQMFTDATGRAFKNQGDCVSYVATIGKNGAQG